MRVDMLKGSPVKAVLRFSLPLMLGNVFQLFYNIADSIVVGRFVSSSALAAVGAVGPVNSLLVGFAFGLTSGRRYSPRQKVFRQCFVSVADAFGRTHRCRFKPLAPAAAAH